MKLLRWAKRLWVGPYKPIERPAFPVNDKLKARADAIRIREKLGDPKSTRRILVQENPDTFKKPIDFDTWYGPV